MGRQISALLLMIALVGCGGENSPMGDIPDGSSGQPDGSSAKIPCDPALAITPTSSDVVPYGTVYFSATGGTGDYRFQLADNQSGAELNESTGIYVSGDGSGKADQVIVTDRGCDGKATAMVDVHAHLTVTPRSVEMRPGTQFSFDVSGGSGTYECSFVGQESGGSITAKCAYTAGPATGVDIVRVRDLQTGDYVDADLSIQPGATMTVAGSGHIFIPVGQKFVPTSYGGSGHLQPTVLSGPFTVMDGTLLGSTPGRGTVRFTDRYTAMSVDVPVTVVAALTPDIPRDGERTGEGVIHPTGDLDGDGFNDAVLAFIEPSVGAHYSGVVLVYRGTASGLAATPAQVLSGTTRFETFGSDIDVADIDRDGKVDLLVGADHSDQGSVNNGAVMIYKGVPGGFFATKPSRILRGDNGGDRFGASLVTCDFDGDGFLDLAVGAIDAEDRNVAIPADGQGAIHVFHGSASGYSDRADFVLYGQLPNAMGTFAPVSGMQLGQRLRAGDLDGDGLCDLVAGMPEVTIGGLSDDGVVLIYRGTRQNNLVLTRSPVRTLAAPGVVGQFGWRLAIADIDGDGAEDLAVSHYKSNDRASQSGAVRIYMGGDLTSRAPGDPVLPSEADWIVSGTVATDNVGAGIALGDFDGDSKADLVVGAPRDEESSPTNSGVIRVYRGADIAARVAGGAQYDATGDTPTFKAVGARSSSRLGQEVGLVGRGAILSLAGFDDTYGTEVGAPYYVSTAAPVVKILDLPGQPAGHELGSGLAMFDVDGDGDRDVLIGGPGAGILGLGGNAGMMYYYATQGSGLASTPTAINNAYSGHAASDRYASAITTAGDFNGDGMTDLAVIARSSSRPSSFGSEYANPTQCPGSLSRAGALLVYLGSPAGLEAEPAFVYYGPRSDANTRVLRGGFDHDGDGYDDIIVGGPDWSSAGGFAIVYGRPDSTSGILVICDAERYLGVETDSWLGDSAAPLGDIDGDGCDEVAVGAPRENLGVVDQGSVRVLWGWGGSGCPVNPKVTTAVLTIDNTNLGTGMDGGRDIDGDGIGDLVVGGSSFSVDFVRVGAAWVIPGAYLASLPRQTISGQALPTSSTTQVATILPSLGDHGRYGVVGTAAAGLFGDAIAVIPDPLDPSRGAIAAGIPLGNAGGTSLAGGVAIYRWVNATLGGLPGLDDVPYALFGGETMSAGGLLGATLEGDDVAGVPVLLVGAPLSDQHGMDNGTGYMLRFE